MKLRGIAGLTAAMLLGLNLSSAQAAPTFTFDENGNASWANANPTPIAGGGVAYTLPAGFTFAPPPGTLLGWVEPGTAPVITNLSEVIQVLTPNQFAYYSEPAEPGSPAPDLADTDLPLYVRFPGANIVGPEVGPSETENHIEIAAAGATFIGISDVPEPATLLMATLGTLGLCGYSWRQRRPATA